ncbi:MAG: hypothetical protein WBN50_06550 [Lutimonas sp.]
MKLFFKIILIGLILFLIGIVATKISIDHSFRKIDGKSASKDSVSAIILQQTKQV